MPVLRQRPFCKVVLPLYLRAICSHCTQKGFLLEGRERVRVDTGYQKGEVLGVGVPCDRVVKYWTSLRMQTVYFCIPLSLYSTRHFNCLALGLIIFPIIILPIFYMDLNQNEEHAGFYFMIIQK